MTAEQMNEHIDQFQIIWKEGHEENPMPDDVKLTVYCDNDADERGFLENVTTDEMGLDALIARKWIRHAHLLELINNK